MVKLRRHPSSGVMTDIACLRDSLRGMIGIIGVLIILQVAGHARLCRYVVVPVRVALITLQRGMRASQRKPH